MMMKIPLLLVLGNAEAFGVNQLFFAAKTRSSTQLAAEGSKITMPALSSTMKEGRVVSWLKSEGESIEAGEAIMVVESDKADMDVEAFEDGFLAKIIVGEGEMAPVGEPVALIASEESDIEAVIASYNGGGGVAPAAPAASAPVAKAPAQGRYLFPSSEERQKVAVRANGSMHFRISRSECPIQPD